MLDIHTRASLKESISEFYYKEADLLDRRGLAEWIELFTENATYTMPLHRNVKHGNWDNEKRLGSLEVAWMADTREVLKQRVEQMLTGVHWAEEPVSRYAHLITNIRVLSFDDHTKLAASRSRFLVYRNRLERDVDFLIGTREDELLQVEEDEWKIRNRVIYLQQNVLLAKNISLFI